MSRLIFILLLAGACLGLDSLVVQPDTSKIDDMRLRISDPDYNYGIAYLRFSGWELSGDFSLIKFDTLSFLPEGITIDSAFIVFTTYVVGGTGVLVVAALNRGDAIEGTKNGVSASTGESCWNWAQRYLVSWGKVGCDSIPIDRTGILDSQVVSIADLPILKVNITNSLIYCIDNAINYGFRIGTPTPIDIRARQSEYSVLSECPMLKVYYTVPVPTGGSKYNAKIYTNQFGTRRVRP